MEEEESIYEVVFYNFNSSELFFFFCGVICVLEVTGSILTFISFASCR
jgi:hypothetical protein